VFAYLIAQECNIQQTRVFYSNDASQLRSVYYLYSVLIILQNKVMELMYSSGLAVEVVTAKWDPSKASMFTADFIQRCINLETLDVYLHSNCEHVRIQLYCQEEKV